MCHGHKQEKLACELLVAKLIVNPSYQLPNFCLRKICIHEAAIVVVPFPFLWQFSQPIHKYTYNE